MHSALNSLLSELDTFEDRFKVAVQQKQAEAGVGFIPQGGQPMDTTFH